MRLRYTNRAANDLETIKAWSRGTFGDRRTKTYLERIENCCDRLASGTELSRSVEGPDGVRRSYSVGSHVVYFRIDGGDLLILRILHSRMDLPRHL